MNKLFKYSATFALLGTLTFSAPAATEAASGPSPTEQKQQVNLGNQNIMSVLWYQNSTEAKALYVQGYNAAKLNLDKEIKKQKAKGGKKLAIALDIDETVLDNSPYQGYAALNNKAFPEGWHEWVASAQAKAVPGARDFLKYADKKGVQIFYVSDRDKAKDLKATKRNLKSEGLPQAKESHILLKDKKKDKSKQPRRDKIQKKYNLVMLFGDNLLDFADPKEATEASRTELLNKHKDDFGKKYIIFPNPMYGSWEATIFNNDFSKSPEEKDALRKGAINYFDPKTAEVKQYKMKK